MKTFKKSTLHTSTIIGLVLAACLAHYLLLQDNFLHCSIDAIAAIPTHTHSHFFHGRYMNLLIVGLLPVYMAMIIFGTAAFGAYLASKWELLRMRFAIKAEEI